MKGVKFLIVVCRSLLVSSMAIVLVLTFCLLRARVMTTKMMAVTMMTNQRAVVMEEVMTAMMAMTGMMVEMEGGEEEDEEDVPPLDTLLVELRDVKEQIKDMSPQKWKIEEQIAEHCPDSKEAKNINRRKNANVSRATASTAVDDLKNTLITLFVKKDDTTTEDFKVRLSMSGGKFIQLVADKFNVKKSKFYLTCPNGDLLQAGNRVLFNQKLKPNDIISITFRGAGGANRVKTEMKAKHKVARLQEKLRADNRQCDDMCDDAEVDAVVIALEGVKNFLVDCVDVQQLLTNAALDALKAVLALYSQG